MMTSRPTSGPVKKRTAQEELPKKIRVKNGWNSYLTDDDRFKLSKEEIIKKKNLYVSRHNIFVADTNIPSEKRTKSSVRRKKTDSIFPKDEYSDLSLRRVNIRSNPVEWSEDDDYSTSSEHSTNPINLTALDMISKRPKSRSQEKDFEDELNLRSCSRIRSGTSNKSMILIKPGMTLQP